MKMSLGCCYMLLLAFIAVVSGVVVKEIRKVGVGALFKPDITTSLKDVSITWKYSAGGEVIKVIEWDHDFGTLEKLNPKFKTRVDLDKTTGELTIRDLQLEHTGLYTIEISNKEQEKKFNLIVMEGVPTPTLKHKKTDNPEVMYLNCGNKKMTQLSWNCSNGETPQHTSPEKPGQEESIIFRRTNNPDFCCTCTLFNDVDKKTSDVVCEKDLFPGSVNIVGIVLGILSIPIILLVLIPFYLYVECINRNVYSLCNGRPCVGGIVTSLDKCSKFKHETNPPGNNDMSVREPLH